jgi:hypothetical protein
VDQDGFAGACLTGEHMKGRPEGNTSLLDDCQIFDIEFL